MLTQSVLNPSLRAGELVHQVTFSHPDVTQDSFGQPINTWSNYLTTRAKVENLSGQQNYQQSVFTAEAVWRITLHYHPGIASGDRCFYGSHVYVVQIVNNLFERNRVIELTCLEIQGAS
jgi:SPP1 family predicted phage head-tail adaptor